MNKIAFLLCLLLALVGHLQRRLQSSFATIGRALFVALACLVLVACGGPSEEELAERAAKQAEWAEAREAKLENLRNLIRNEEYCEAHMEAFGWLVTLAAANSPNYGLVGKLSGIVAVASKGCNPKADESKTWACAEGHSCR